MYPIELTKPMAMELENVGFKSLKSADEVADLLNKKTGTTLVVVNSVCGCAAANARPGVIAAIKNEKKPDNLVTVFAGVDSDAVREWEHLRESRGSGPCLRWRGGSLAGEPARRVAFWQRHGSSPVDDRERIRAIHCSRR